MRFVGAIVASVIEAVFWTWSAAVLFALTLGFHGCTGSLPSSLATASPATTGEVRHLRVIELTDTIDGAACTWLVDGSASDPLCCPDGWAAVGINGDAVVCVEL